jgi:hypothetical protein
MADGTHLSSAISASAPCEVNARQLTTKLASRWRDLPTAKSRRFQARLRCIFSVMSDNADFVLEPHSYASMYCLYPFTEQAFLADQSKVVYEETQQVLDPSNSRW